MGKGRVMSNHGSLTERLRVVLVEPEGRINFGFVLRLARNFSVQDICVVKPKFDLKDPEVLEFAAGGVEAVEFVFRVL